MPISFPNYELLGARLLDLREAWQAEPARFAPGDLVRWKRGFHQGDLMGPNDLGVVLAVHDRPEPADDLVPEHPDYRLPLDVELGVIARTDEFCTVRTSRRCLESAEPVAGRVPELLRGLHAAFVSPAPLWEGQLVQWKPFCAPEGFAHPALPGVVLTLLPAAEAGRTGGDSTAIDSRQPLDLAVAVEDSECGFRLLWTDRRRVAPYEGPIASLPAGAVAGTAAPDTWETAAEAAAAVAARLLDRHRRMMTPEALPASGTFVRWKPGLRDRVLPLDGDAAVVLAVCEPPQFEPELPAGSPLWRQPLSLTLGLMDQDGRFAVCRYDARRFEALPPEGAEHRPFLERAAARYRRRHRLAAGDAVVWKPGLADAIALPEGQPAILLQAPEDRPDKIPPQAGRHAPDTGSALIALRGDGGECLVVETDAARLQPAPPESDGEEAAKLRACIAALRRAPALAPGALVEWNEGLCPLAWSDPEAHGIVIEPSAVPPGPAQRLSDAFLLETVDPQRFRVGFLDDEGELRIRTVRGYRLRPAALPDAEQDDELRDFFERFTAPRDLRPGQIVFTLEGLSGWNTLELTPDAPGIVLQRLDPPLRSPQSEPLAEDYDARADLLVGGLDDDGDFVVVHADSRRLAPHPAQRGPAARRLQGFRRRLELPRVIAPGMLVAWKDRLCAHSALPNGLPAIVLEVCDAPFPAAPETVRAALLGSVALAASRDTVIGVWRKDQWVRIHCDGRRLEPFDARIHGEIFQRKATEEARRMEEFSRMLDDYDEEDPPF